MDEQIDRFEYVISTDEKGTCTFCDTDGDELPESLVVTVSVPTEPCPWEPSRPEHVWLNAPRHDWKKLREQWLADNVIGKPVESKPLLIGRNERCPCQSGKKWKRCCGHPDSKGESNGIQ